MPGTHYYCNIACPFKDCDYHFQIKTNKTHGREYNNKKRYIVRHIEKTHNKTKKEAIRTMNEFEAHKNITGANMIDLSGNNKKELFSVLSMDVNSKTFDPKSFSKKLSVDTKKGILNHFETLNDLQVNKIKN